MLFYRAVRHNTLPGFWPCEAVVIAFEKYCAMPPQERLSDQAYQGGSECTPSHGYHNVSHGEFLITTLEGVAEEC